MATYYPNSSTQQLDVLPSPYERDQKLTSFSDSSSLLNGNNMMMYHLISPGSSMNPENGVEIPSINGRNEMIFIPPNGDSICMQPISGPLNASVGENGEQNMQGLSLSLSTQMSNVVPTSQFQFQYSNHMRPITCKIDDESSSLSKDMRNSDYISYDGQGGGHNNIFGTLNNSQYSMNSKAMNYNNPYQYEQTGVASMLLKSKYLKPTQELLDEVINVRDAIKRPDSRKEKVSSKVDEGSKESKDGSQGPLEGNESGVGSGSNKELSPSERQELQSKLDKFHSMLDEVDRRYKQYCNQIQILISSFEMVIGSGSSKPYISLAWKTISRHFRNLRDAITGQIQETRKSLGEDENGPGGSIPRLRYVDQQLRQQRALQQFGLTRNAWRPQRGLPENAVTILRAWLFEHFLHPYPKDSEKIMLARQTGLTRSQVANWFINARVRLWKPMVEEMYKEEFGESDILNSRSSQENTPKSTTDKSWGFEDRREELQQSPTSIAHEPHDSKLNNNHGFFNPNEPNTNGPGPEHGHPHLMVNNVGYQFPELGSFSVDNQVSLALGLQQCEGNHTNDATIGVATSEYNPYIEQVNQHQHILDFVA